MKKQQIIENIEIEGLTPDCKGRAVIDGDSVHVRDTLPGDRVTIRVLKRRRKAWEAVVESILAPSPERVEPKCAHFADCGGCRLQHFSMDAQLAWKQNLIDQWFADLDLEDTEQLPIIASPEFYYHRNKLEFSFGDRRWLTAAEVAEEADVTVRTGLGFHVSGRFDRILHVDHCHLQRAPSNRIRDAVYDYACDHDCSFYNPRAHSGLLRNLLIRTANTGEVMVVLVVSEWNDQAEGALAALKDQFSEITSLQYVVNDKKNDSIHDLPVQHYAGSEFVTEEIAGCRFRVHAKSFLQTNSQQTENLYGVVRSFAALSEDDHVYDLYSGIGTISLILARDCKRVIGIEEVESATADATINAQENNIGNAEFHTGKVEDLLSESFAAAHGGVPDVVICDPPRAGIHHRALSALVELRPERVVYVSCNPKTQATDLRRFSEHYRIERMQAVDMFPHTAHVEHVVLLTKRP